MYTWYILSLRLRRLICAFIACHEQVMSQCDSFVNIMMISSFLFQFSYSKCNNAANFFFRIISNMEEQEIWSVNYLKLQYPKQKWDTQAIAIIILKLEQPESQWFYYSVMHHRDGMANSADPDQSALGLHCLPRPVCSSLFAQNEVLRIITVFYRYHGFTIQ